MNNELLEDFSTLMYFLTKQAAMESFNDFLEEIEVSQENYEEIKKYLKEKYNINTYI